MSVGKPTRAPRFVVVGIGADGWDGLSHTAQRELASATTIYGSTRQLELLTNRVNAPKVSWRSPMTAHLDEVASSSEGSVVHILASGDPMFHGVGASLIARVGADRVRVIPSVSSATLAAARMGWELARVDVVSLVTAPVETILSHADGGRRLLVLCRDASTPAAVAKALADNGFGESALTVLEELGGPNENAIRGVARDWTMTDGHPLAVIALECGGPRVSIAPGLDDDLFENDGQLTKQTVRAVTVSALAPASNQTLWDIGAGSGSISIEWLRLARGGRAVAFESAPERVSQIQRNAQRHGVSDRLTVVGAAPNACDQAPPPDTVFIGGGLRTEVFDAAWSRLEVGGRLVANAVTIENQALLVELRQRHGGRLTRLNVENAAPLGTMTTWRPALPIVTWVVDKK